MDLTRNPVLILQELHDAAHPDSPLDQAWVDRMLDYCEQPATIKYDRCTSRAVLTLDGEF